MASIPIDAASRALAAGYMAKQVKQLDKWLDKLHEPHSDKPVHKARVATRRLKAVFAMLGECFDPDLMHDWSDQFKGLRKRLGPARDCDVQIKFLREFRKKASKRDRPGVDLLLAESRQQRESLQPAVSKAARKLTKSGVLGEIRKQTKRARVDFDEENEPLLTEPVFLRCRDTILHRLEDLTDKQEVLEDPSDRHGHHQMRIAAKHLRYSLEIARRPLGDVVIPMKDDTEDMQELLGEVHDCDVWVDHIEKLLSGDGPTLDERTRPGVEKLSSDRRRQRDKEFAKARTLWQQVQDQGRIDCLKGYLRRDPADVAASVNV